MKRKAAVLLAMAALTAACGGRGGTGGPEIVTDTVGDTIVVRTVSGSVWGGDAHLVAGVSVGELEGDDDYMFGRLYDIAVDDDDNLFVLDGQDQAVRVFDAGGKFVRKLGRKGQGPGELWDAEAMALLPDGRVVVRDPGNTRVQLFGPGPDEESAWEYTAGGITSSTALWTDREGRTYLWALDTSKSARSWTLALTVLGPDGSVVGTIQEPYADFRPVGWPIEVGGIKSYVTLPFSPHASWTIHPSGAVVSGTGDATGDAYRINLQRPDGVLRIERVHEPVRVSRGEAAHVRDDMQRSIRRAMPGWIYDGPEIPDTKPVFYGLYAGRDGRIWVSVSTAGREIANEDHDPADPLSSPVRWRAPLRFDVFEPDGTYLGAVVPPGDFTTYPRPVFDTDDIWAVTRDALDVERVVRYRMVRPRR